MASVNDYGGPTDFLASVPFGGIGGWAEAVAAALDNRDETTDQRIAALEAQVLKLSGGTLTGDLEIDKGVGGGAQAIHFRRNGVDRWIFRQYDDSVAGGEFEISPRDDAGGGNPTIRISRDKGTIQYLSDQQPTSAKDLTTKGYVDGHVQGRSMVIGSAGGATVTFSSPFASPPAVVAQAHLQSTNGTSLFATVESVTTSNFIVRVRNSAGTGVSGATISYVAVGDPA